MKISAVVVTNFKRLVDVEIRPDADRTLVLIAGKNAQGKSSLMDALTAAFGGADALPADPVRHGAESAEIRVELDGGALIVRRVIKDGKSTIELRDADGRLASPQARLDKIVGARFIDPIAFLSLEAKEQRAHLMRLIPGAKRIEELDEAHARVFAKRTEVGRDLTRAKGEFARIPEIEPVETVDISALLAEQRAIGEQYLRGDRARSAVAQAETLAMVDRADVAAAEQELAKLERHLAKLVASIKELREETLPAKIRARDQREIDLVAAREQLDVAAATVREQEPRRAAIESALARATEQNRGAAMAEAGAKRRTDAAAAIDKLAAEVNNHTERLDQIDSNKAEILAAAKLPVEGLTIADAAVLFRGVPLAQASGAEQLRVALAVAIAGSPNLRDVWVRDGALLDEDSLAALAREAAAAGIRVWVERVGDRDPGAIVIHEGRIASRATTEAA